MNKKLLLITPSVAVLAFLGTTYLFYGQNTPAFLDWLKQQAITKLQPTFTAWNNLPQTYKTIIFATLTTVPSLLATFFAWTKNRAMRKLQETQLQSRTQYNQLTGEIGEAKNQLSTLQGQKVELQNQVKAYADGNTAIKTLTGNLEEATSLVAEKQRQIEQLQQTVTNLAGQIKGMETQINYVKRLE